MEKFKEILHLVQIQNSGRGLWGIHEVQTMNRIVSLWESIWIGWEYGLKFRGGVDVLNHQVFESEVVHFQLILTRAKFDGGGQPLRPIIEHTIELGRNDECDGNESNNNDNGSGNSSNARPHLWDTRKMKPHPVDVHLLSVKPLPKVLMRSWKQSTSDEWECCPLCLIEPRSKDTRTVQ